MFVLFLFANGVLLPKLMFGYIDPGTGSYIIQLLIASLVGVSFVVKIFWKKIKLFFGNILKKKSRNEEKP